MSYKAAFISIVIAIICFSAVSTASQTWKVDEEWFGYPIPAMTLYGDHLCVITSNNYTSGNHFKLPSESLTISFPPKQKADPSSTGIQVWFNIDNQWVLNKTGIGIKILSNIVQYDNKLYVSVDTGNFTAMLEYDGSNWDYMNDTYDSNIHDLTIHDEKLHAVSGNQVLYYNGIEWKTPNWFTNISSSIDNIASYNGSIYITTKNNQAMYRSHFRNMTKLDVPQYGIYPTPLTIYNGKMFCAYKNQIYTYDGYEFEVLKVVSPTFTITSMYPYDEKLYIGTESTINDNKTKIFSYDGESFKETEIESQSVYGFEAYQGNLYAGTNMGLYIVVETIDDIQDNINCAIISAALIGLMFIVMGLYPFNESFEDMLFISGALAFWSISFTLLAVPEFYLSIIIFIIPLFVFMFSIAGLTMFFDTGFEPDFQSKDFRILAIFIIIFFIIEIATGVFSKAILPS